MDKVGQVSQLLVIPVMHQSHALVFPGSKQNSMGHGANKARSWQGNLMEHCGNLLPLGACEAGGHHGVFQSSVDGQGEISPDFILGQESLLPQIGCKILSFSPVDSQTVPFNSHLGQSGYPVE